MSVISETTGIHRVATLPSPEFEAFWESIIVDQQTKDTLFSRAVLNFTMRPKVPRASVPLHGLILLVGPPGTGKTTLAKGLASRVAEVVGGNGGIAYVEVEPHSLAGASLGKSQKAVMKLFAGAIAEHAMAGPTFVLLDEVETLAVDRKKLSMDANPIDVHRATDAALVQLDHLAEQYPNLLIVATSNFPQSIDSAFLSRCDLVLEMPLPTETACLEILRDTLTALSKPYPKLKSLTKDHRLAQVAKRCVGLDGRQIRKIVVNACAFDKSVAFNPSLLEIDHLLQAADGANGRGK